MACARSTSTPSSGPPTQRGRVASTPRRFGGKDGREVAAHEGLHDGALDALAVRVLDAFAGSGALGIEALSRGALHATSILFSADLIIFALWIRA